MGETPKGRVAALVAVAAALGLAGAALHSSESGADLPEAAAKVDATKGKARKEVTEVVPGIVSPAPAAAAPTPSGSSGKENTDAEAKQSLLNDALEIIKKELPDYDDSYHDVRAREALRVLDTVEELRLDPEFVEAEREEQKAQKYTAWILPPRPELGLNPDWYINVERGGDWCASVEPEISTGTVRVELQEGITVSNVEPYQVAKLIKENDALQSSFDLEEEEIDRKYDSDRYKYSDRGNTKEQEKEEFRARCKAVRSSQLGKYGTVSNTEKKP